MSRQRRDRPGCPQITQNMLMAQITQISLMILSLSASNTQGESAQICEICGYPGADFFDQRADRYAVLAISHQLSSIGHGPPDPHGCFASYAPRRAVARVKRFLIQSNSIGSSATCASEIAARPLDPAYSLSD